MTHSIDDSQILDAVLRVVVERGYIGATTKAIAVAAEINEGTLFRRFGNKQKLVTEAIRREARRFEALAAHRTGDVALDLATIVRFYRDLMTVRGPTIIFLLMEATRHAELHEAMQAASTIVDAVGQLLVEYQADGTLVREPREQAFAALVGPLMAGAVVAMTHPGQLEQALDPEAYVERFLEGRRA